MKKNLLKSISIIFVFGLLALIPFNSQLTFGYSSTDVPSCSKDKPADVVLYEPNHPLLPKATNQGEIRLNWHKAARASTYFVGFGLSPRNYIYGASNLSDVDNFTVRFLSPGKKYYFAVKPSNGCMPGNWSNEWSAVVGGRGVVSLANNYVAPAPRENTLPSGGSLNKPNTGTAVNPTVVQEQIPPQVPSKNELPPVGENQPAPKVGFFQSIAIFFSNLFGGNK